MERTSVEALAFTLEERDNKDVTAATVAVAIVARESDLASATWLPCTYVSSSTDTRTGKTATHWQTSTDITWATYTEPSYLVFTRLTDSPATPAACLGHLYMT